MTRLLQSAIALRSWLFEQALPFWFTNGMHPGGMFYEAIDLDGRPVDGETVRPRSHARQVFSFALACEHGWRMPGARRIVRQSLQRMLETLRPDGLAGRLLSTRRRVLVDDTADLYDTACCLLAVAQCRAVVGDDITDAWSSRILAGIDGVLARADGGFSEFLPAPPYRVQNHHMHLLEALLPLAALRRDKQHARRANSLLEFIADTFFDRSCAVVRERTGEPSPAGYEPGHSMEWVWLLGRSSRLLGCPFPAFAFELYDKACRASVAHRHSLLVLHDDDSAIDPGARLWSQAEELKAHLCIAELSGSAAAASMALRCATRIVDEWLSVRTPGGWIDRLNEHGEPDGESMPASSLYHLSVAISELSRVSALNDARVRP